MQILIIIGCSAILIGLLLYINNKYQSALDFRRCNWILYRHCILQSKKITSSVRDMVTTEYMQLQLSVWRLFFSRKRYKTENFYTLDQIETYFTPFT